jgi:hypothetical protein
MAGSRRHALDASRPVGLGVRLRALLRRHAATWLVTAALVALIGAHLGPLIIGTRFATNHDQLKGDPIFNEPITDRSIGASIISHSAFYALPYYRDIIRSFRCGGGWFYNPRGYGGATAPNYDPLLNATALPGAVLPPNYWLGLRTVLLVGLAVFGVYLLTGLVTIAGSGRADHVPSASMHARRRAPELNSRPSLRKEDGRWKWSRRERVGRQG